MFGGNQLTKFGWLLSSLDILAAAGAQKNGGLLQLFPSIGGSPRQRYPRSISFTPILKSLTIHNLQTGRQLGHDVRNDKKRLRLLPIPGDTLPIGGYRFRRTKRCSYKKN